MSEPSGSGFEERAAAYEAWPEVRVPQTYRLTVGPGGRVVIPADVRRELAIEEGTLLIGTVEDGELRIVTAATALKKIQAIASKYKKPGESVVDEFLAERRAMWGED